MKNLLLFLFLFSCPFFVFTQNLYDQKWILGRGGNVPNSYFGGAMCDFSNGSPPEVSYYEVPDTYSADNNLTMSDSVGNLLFFTNGCKIISYNNQVMENGYDLNIGEAATYYCISTQWAYEGYQSLLSIPYPDRPGEYLLFHAAWEEYTGTDTKIIYYYTHIDMNANGGLGKVVAKNQVLYGPDWIVPATTAVRHANGRDWWIMVGGYDTHIFRTWLVTPQGVSQMEVQDWNSLWSPNQFIGLAGCFSPDGSKYVRPINSKPDQFFLFDFDRCSGQLFNPISLEIPDTLMKYAFPIFSPNSRYLYMANRITSVYQFDLHAPDISASAVKVGAWDGVYDTTLTIDIVTGFHKMTHAPDGKIYITTYDHTVFLHVIHQPDEKGSACQFDQRGVTLPVRNQSLPNYPNYRLYDLPDSACDTLGINAPSSGMFTAQRPANISFGVNPNPSQWVIFFNWPIGYKPVRLIISDVSGREILGQQTGSSESDNLDQLNITGLPQGLYFVKVQFEKGESGISTFSVLR